MIQAGKGWFHMEKKSLPRSVLIAAVSLLSFIILTLLLNAYIDRQRRSVYEQQYRSMAENTVDRIVSQLNYRINLYEVQLNSISYNKQLYNQLQDEYPTFLSQWDTARTMEQAYQYVHGLLPGITQFRIYHHNQTLLENGGLLWKPGDRLLDGQNEKEWYDRKLNAGKPEWAVYLQPYNGESYSVVTHSIPRGAAGSAGVLYLRIANSVAFNSIWNSVSHSGVQYALTDGNGTVFLASSSEMVGKQPDDSAFAHAENSRNPAVDPVVLWTDNGYHILRSISNGWRLYSFIPMNEINRDLDQLNRLYGYALLTVLILGSGAALTIFQSYRRRLRKINQKLESHIPEVTLRNRPQSGLTDHVSQVEANYGQMISRMKDLKLREMEEAIRAMESYVNPHFLYNTLGLIRWRALDDGDEDLCALVDDMTTYYRLSLSGGRSVVTVSDEIAHLQAYVSIQQRRWGEMVRVEYEIDNHALEAYTPKNILQTIVENCYVHGLVPGRTDHLIRICVKLEGEQILFEVSDNGSGIPQDKLAYLNRDDDTEVSGIGIRSIRQRLKLYFGDKTSMRITSAEGQGTTVQIRIPYCRTEPSIIGGE